jgi:hypothetical protein
MGIINNLGCSAVTALLIMSLILGAVGGVLVALIITIPIGVILLILSGIFFLMSLFGIVALLRKTGFKKMKTWCKINVVFCIIVFIALLIEIIIGIVNNSK